MVYSTQSCRCPTVVSGSLGQPAGVCEDGYGGMVKWKLSCPTVLAKERPILISREEPNSR